MPIWLYEVTPLAVAVIMIIFVETLSLIGLFLARRFLLPRLRFGEGVNDAVSGTVQAIGVFYGITVGLIAVAVWNTNAAASDLVSREASAIGGLYRDVAGYPQPLRDELMSKLREYTRFVIEQDWPSQRKGVVHDGSAQILSEFQVKLFPFEPTNQSQIALHAEALHAFNNLAECRRLRVNAVDSGLSDVMWGVIWAGAAISIGVAYLFKIDDGKMHALLVLLMGGFLALVLFLIVINDKPFYGAVAVSPQPYEQMLQRLVALPK
jgi:hypothetical protein